MSKGKVGKDIFHHIRGIEIPTHVNIIYSHPSACQSAYHFISTPQNVDNIQNHHPGKGLSPPYFKQEISLSHAHSTGPSQNINLALEVYCSRLCVPGTFKP